jgi:hypothetical protein
MGDAAFVLQSISNSYGSTFGVGSLYHKSAGGGNRIVSVEQTRQKLFGAVWSREFKPHRPVGRFNTQIEP